MIFNFPGYKLKIYLYFVSKSTILILLFTFLIAIEDRDFFIAIGFFLFGELIALIVDLINFRKNVLKYYETITKNSLYGSRIHNEFYENYYIGKGEKASIKGFYSDINRSIETDSNFYLKNGYDNSIKIIIKKDCSLELINFIRKKFPDMENHLGNEQKLKKRSYNPKFIKYGMLLLFLITLFSLFGAYKTKELIDELMFEPWVDYTQNMWIFWCWLPIQLHQ